MFFQSLECLIFLTLFFLNNNCSPVNCDNNSEDTRKPIVTIPYGTLLGTTLTTRYGRKINAFRSIPYGKPPVGRLRFANPVAAEPWKGILDASAEPSMCLQGTTNPGETVGSEDCLYLRVFTPELSQDKHSSLLPVMVYIHGGGFRFEYPAKNTPEYLLDEDVILVVINYRVGSLGFLCTGDENASGNWGSKDQVLALEWVQDNIECFGGNPDQVTIFGESAGAASVHLLTLSDTTKGLFHKCILQSGSALASWAVQPTSVISKRAFELGKYVNCNNETSKSLIGCLRTKNAVDIVLTETNFVPPGLIYFLKVIWGPTVEANIQGAFLTDTPKNLIKQGKIRDVPWMIGVVRDEGLLYSSVFYGSQTIWTQFRQDFDYLISNLLLWSWQPDSGVAWLKATKEYYFNNDLTTNTTRVLGNMTSLIGDDFFNYPTYKALQQQHELSRNPQYFYNFNYRGRESFSLEFGDTTQNLGVAHCDDLIYLFPKNFYFDDSGLTLSETDHRMIDIMIQFWASFATDGKPTLRNQQDKINWQRFSNKDKYLRIGNGAELTLEMQNSYLPERMKFWDDLIAVTET